MGIKLNHKGTKAEDFRKVRLDFMERRDNS
jgi:hypothetical protein